MASNIGQSNKVSILSVDLRTVLTGFQNLKQFRKAKSRCNKIFKNYRAFVCVYSQSPEMIVNN